MELIRTVMLNVILIVFLTTLLDLLLPDGSLRSYVKMTMGFFVVLTLLQPVMQLIEPDGMLQQWQMTLPAITDERRGDAVAVQGELYEQQQRQIDQLYQEKLNEQIRSLLLLSTELEQMQVNCTVEEQTLKEIEIVVAQDASIDTARIAAALNGYYGLASEQIVVKEEALQIENGPKNIKLGEEKPYVVE